MGQNLGEFSWGLPVLTILNRMGHGEGGNGWWYIKWEEVRKERWQTVGRQNEGKQGD